MGARRPFKCLLDVGLKPTTTGSRIFGALKGASDGGLFVPQSPKRFPGYDRETGKLDADFHKKLIMGGHVAEYMSAVAEEDAEAFAKLFAKYIAAGVTADTYEDVLAKVHAASAPTRPTPPRRPCLLPPSRPPRSSARPRAATSRSARTASSRRRPTASRRCAPPWPR